eukprot:s29_g7.t1
MSRAPDSARHDPEYATHLRPQLVSSSPVVAADFSSVQEGAPLTVPGLQEVSEAFPQAVRRGGSYNGRDCVDFGALAEALRFGGHGTAAAELNKLANVAFAHKDGRVEESWDGSGWVGYAEAEAVLAAPRPEAPRSLADLVPKPCAASARKAAPVTRRWGRAAQAAAEQKGARTPADSSALHLGGGGASMG